MVQTVQASLIAIDALESMTGLQEIVDLQFFPEWQSPLSDLDDWERQALDRLKSGYFNLLKKPPMLENTVRMAILHPLLFIAGLYLAPFQSKPEKSITLILEDEDGTCVEGRADVLVLKEQLWLMTVESKRAGIAVEEAIAQLLSYMLSSPNSPTFGMITNGGSFLFAKLVKSPTPCYALSDIFVLRKQQNELYAVLGILKRLAVAL
jgi:Type I restriction enzyme R protein N terminus (HSDR_N)